MTADRAKYPAHWWAKIPRVDIPEWEVLPEEAGPGEVILSKRHELGVLSNFWPTPFDFHGKKYASIEGFWQMTFYPESPDDPRAQFKGLQWPHTREEVGAMTGFTAWNAGVIGFENMRAMGINWVTFEGKRLEYWTQAKGGHYQLIVEALRAKAEQNESVKKALLSTGDLILRPDHRNPPDAPPSWDYFDIWMQIRKEITLS